PGRFADALERSPRNATALRRAVATTDRTAFLDRCGAMFFADPHTADGGHAEGEVAESGTSSGSDVGANASVPLEQTFTLASRPGAARTIWLDFRGGTVTDTSWNASYGSPITARPFSITAPASTAFSAAELREIQRAWQVVAEDYAPFDVNVTLADPGIAAIDRSSSHDRAYGTRVIVTGGGPIYTKCSCGGVAYVDVFNDYGTSHMWFQPAWVFSAGTGTSGKSIGEAASHEAGHNFGLSHDGTRTSGYYRGSEPWAPILGAAYSQPVSQFSRGEYAGASTSQDDLAVVATGAPLRSDDHGNTVATATRLDPTLQADGVVTTRGDVDAFTFTGEGQTTVAVTPAAGLPNLDVELTVVDAAGSTIARVDPPAARVSSSSASGLGATWSTALPAGEASYTLLVDGVGTGDPRTAGRYSDYGSLGNYRVTVSTGAAVTDQPLAFTTSSRLPNARKRRWYDVRISTTDGVPDYAWQRVSGSLPRGLRLVDTDRRFVRIAGRPTARGWFRFTMVVRDADGESERRAFRLRVRR
ncbi:MAG: zinc-dependent metalloprotease family protein, partial [Nocardioides sp.]